MISKSVVYIGLWFRLGTCHCAMV